MLQVSGEIYKNIFFIEHLRKAASVRLNMIFVWLAGRDRISESCGNTNPFHATGFFLSPVKTLENLFLILSGGMERRQWHEIG